ncbi:MAG TPA: primase-helicase family protein [Mucilaginibacter sp.]|nr:primase-helicase family protein [Mucilaginibacter sp.]
MQGDFIKPEEILNATNQGLDIILRLYPDAQLSVTKHNRKFKIRQERSASASLSPPRPEKGREAWVVTDFGDDQKPRNGIMCWMLEKGLEFVDALKELAVLYNVSGSSQERELYKAEYSKRDATADEDDGQWLFKVREGNNFTDFEIGILFSSNVLKQVGWDKGGETKKNGYNKLRSVLKEYRFYALESYTVIKDRKAMTFAATDNYPIFLIDEGTHKKIYQPRSIDAGKRFMYHGKKPANFIHGLAQLTDVYNENKEALESEAEDDDLENTGSKGEPIGNKKSKDKSPKVPEVIICSGGSDAINVAMLGYRVVWKNSETDKLFEGDYKKLEIMCHEIYQLQDIDRTGKRSAHELALQYLDIKTIELPEDLRKFYDARNKPCKDVRDYLNHFNQYDFKDLVKTALPYRFWEKKANYDREGKFKGYDYDFDNVQAYNFLAKNGFYQYRFDGKKTDSIYIKIDGNIVKEVTPQNIKRFFHSFLEERMMEKDLRNRMYRSNQMSENSFSNLPDIAIDFSDSDDKTQYVFYPNKTLEVTAAGIKEFKPGEVDKYIWEDKIIPHRWEKLDPPFRITKDKVGSYDIEVLDNSCLFFRYLINTSRVHWRKEIEVNVAGMEPAAADKYIHDNHFNIAGEKLTDDERDEQKRHLINKVFSIGYLLHRHKKMSRAWMVFAMDDATKGSEDGRSYGGSGKSLLFNEGITRVLRKYFYVGGRNARITEDKHIYDGLTEHHQYILIDDADQYLRFEFFFDTITGKIKVNPKNNQPYVLTFEQLGKMAMTSNFTPHKINLSIERRLLYCVFSDYYHHKGDTSDYKESRDPETDLGKQLYQDFDWTEWNRFYNTMMYCLQFYLSATEKIGPAMNNVTKRTLLAEMGTNFHGWALEYFHKDSGRLDTLVIKEEPFTEFKEKFNMKTLTAQSFKEKIESFCKLYGYELNPVEMRDKTGRIMRRVPVREYYKGTWLDKPNETHTKEMIFLKTTEDVPEAFRPTQAELDLKEKKEDEVPGADVVPDNDGNEDPF